MFDLTDPKLGTTVGDGYRLDERLGAGGMGVVYKGEHVGDGKQVAVKFLHDSFAAIPDLVKRFQREVTAMSRVRHPNLVSIVDSGVSGRVPYLVMEFHAGRALSEVLERGALAPSRALRLARQILDGVGAAHASGVVHRDLKPDNILLVGTGDEECVKILDFGLAKMVHGSETGATQLTNTGLALGTPGYMAPEQARGTPTDHRADLYAVAVILYHMLTGRKPFVSDSPMAVMRMHMEDLPVPLRRAAPDAPISAALERVVLRGMEKDPAARWQDVASFRRALDATPEAGGSVGMRLRLSPRMRRFVARALLLLLVAGAGLYGWRRLSQQKQVRRALDGAMDKAKDTLRAVEKAKDTLRAMTPDPLTNAPKPAPPSTAAKKSDDDDESDDVAPPRDTPGAKLEEASSAPVHAAARKPRISDAARLINAGKIDEGVQLLYELRRKDPHNADIALWLGHAYFKKLWRTDGLREYDAALEERPSLRHNQPLIRDAVWALEDPTFRLARALLRKRVGAAAVGELRRAARESKSPRVQTRAARLAQELSHARSRR